MDVHKVENNWIFRRLKSWTEFKFVINKIDGAYATYLSNYPSQRDKED